LDELTGMPEFVDRAAGDRHRPAALQRLLPVMSAP